MTSYLPELQDTLKVTPSENNQVEVSVTLPADLIGDFVQLLETLTRLAQSVRIKSRHQQRLSLEHRHYFDQQANQHKEKYYQRLRVLFDEFSGQGHDRNTTVKEIGAILRKENHPWSSPDLVRSSLAAAGRPGQPGRPRRQL